MNASATTSSCEAASPTTEVQDDDPQVDDRAEAALKQNRSQIIEQRQRQRLAKQTLSRRMTNVGRFSLVSETAENPSVPVLVLAMTGKPYRSGDFRRLYQDRKLAEKHPRFRARLDKGMTHFVFDDPGDSGTSGGDRGGSETPHKRDRTTDNVRDMVFPSIPVAELKSRINDASLYDPLDLTTTLWEAWTATGGAIGQSGAIPIHARHPGPTKDVESLLLFRAHHCMADGVSLAALFGDLMDEGPELQAKIHSQIQAYKAAKKSTPWWKKLLFGLYYWVWGSIRALLYQAYLFVASWYDRLTHDDPWMILKELHEKKRGNRKNIAPRSLSWATVASVDEVKEVAQFYTQQQRKSTGKRSKITINDIFCSCVSAAIVRQLEYHRAVLPQLSSSSSSSTQPKLSLPSMNLIIPVHLQGGILLPGQSMGNKIGAMVSRIPGEHIPGSVDDPSAVAQQRLLRVHSVLNDRKRTPVAALSYLMAGVMGYFSSSSSSSSSATDGSKSSSVGSSASSWTPWLFRKAHANASVVVTNVRGPTSRLHMEGRPVHVFFGFLPLPAGVPVGLTVTSYNEEIHLTVTAEKYAVPDADQFLGWVRDEYQLLKQKADEATAATVATGEGSRR